MPIEQRQGKMNKDSASKSDAEQIENGKLFSEGLVPLFFCLKTKRC